MQKNYVIIVFVFFISNNATAQLLNDLARFTQTLKNVAVKLTEPVVPPGLPRVMKVPSSGKVILPNGKIVIAPEGSIVEVRATGIFVKVEISDIESTVILPSGGFVELSGKGSVQYLDSIKDVVDGATILIGPYGGTIKIKPK
jgi:hypothetical protein